MKNACWLLLCALVIAGCSTGDYIAGSKGGSESDISDLGTAKLQLFATVAGKIDSLGEIAYIQIRGLERLIVVDSTDSFSVNDLPADTLDLRIVTVDGKSTEQANISTNSGETTPVDIIPRWLYPTVGYAEGTTGGGSALPMTVSSVSAFQSVAAGDNPAVIIVDGRLNVGDFVIGSNKTIIGKDSNAGLYGGRIRVSGSNCIFQNLTFGPSTTDAMELTGATNVFINRCEFFDGADGLLDIVRQSDSVTVSWCKFYYVNQTSHKSVTLIGNSDDAFADSSKLHVTMHHNWYADSCDSYMPRIRFGHVHIYNNYYNSVNNNYCIGLGVYSRIRVENTCFDSVNAVWDDLGGIAADGKIGWQGLKFENAATPAFAPNSFPVFEPPYDYTMDPVDDVKGIVQAGAGNVITGETAVAQNNIPSPSYRPAANRQQQTEQILVFDGLGRLTATKASNGNLDIEKIARGCYLISAKSNQADIVKTLLK